MADAEEIEPTSSSSDTKPPKPTLLTLAAEVQLQIFSYLPAITSTCLGLTCKHFYVTHRNIHGTVAADEGGEWITFRERELELKLHFFLRNWMWEGARLVWGGKYGLRFISEERMEAEEQVIVKDYASFKEANEAWVIADNEEKAIVSKREAISSQLRATRGIPAEPIELEQANKQSKRKTFLRRLWDRLRGKGKEGPAELETCIDNMNRVTQVNATKIKVLEQAQTDLTKEIAKAVAREREMLNRFDIQGRKMRKLERAWQRMRLEGCYLQEIGQWHTERATEEEWEAANWDRVQMSRGGNYQSGYWTFQ